MKNKIVAGLLALFLGTLGIHKFYLNETKPGVIYLVCYLVGLLTCWLIVGLIPMLVISILALIDAIKLFVMDNRVFDNRYNQNYFDRLNSNKMILND